MLLWLFGLFFVIGHVKPDLIGLTNNSNFYFCKNSTSGIESGLQLQLDIKDCSTKELNFELRFSHPDPDNPGMFNISYATIGSEYSINEEVFSQEFASLIMFTLINDADKKHKVIVSQGDDELILDMDGAVWSDVDGTLCYNLSYVSRSGCGVFLDTDVELIDEDSAWVASMALLNTTPSTPRTTVTITDEKIDYNDKLFDGNWWPWVIIGICALIIIILLLLIIFCLFYRRFKKLQKKDKDVESTTTAKENFATAKEKEEKGPPSIGKIEKMPPSIELNDDAPSYKEVSITKSMTAVTPYEKDDEEMNEDEGIDGQTKNTIESAYVGERNEKRKVVSKWARNKKKKNK